MPRIEKYLIRSFTENEAKSSYEVSVPVSSEFLNKVKVLHDGIYGFYSVPTILGSDERIRKDIFKILPPGELIPDGHRLIDILDAIFEVPDNTGGGAEPTQGVMIWPVYKSL